ncbi:MAG: alpha-2-macroglobulin family protein [Elusimicrobiaceae bacterium]|nr:alpha-2-macroglobulin family protein [Elusimicrobiaceae bacterium]
MKILFNRKKAIIATAIFALIIIVLGVILHKSQNKSVDLSRNTPIDKISLVAEELSPRNIRIEDSSKTILGSIPQLKINAEVIDEEDSITSGLPVSNSDWGYQNNSGKEFIAFEYQDKDVSSLVTISPEMRGTWRARGGTSLIFTPEKDWLPGKKYTVSVKKELISPDVNLQKNKLEFSTPENVISLKDFSVNKDATAQRKFDILATLLTSYPMDEKKFISNVNLTLDGKKIKPQITFDQFKRYAFVKYENVGILPKEQVSTLEIKYPQTTKYTLNIPSESKYFKIKDISAIVEKDNNNTPHQLLVLDFSDEVSSKQLANKVEAYLVKKNTKVTPKVLNTAKKLDLEQMPSEEETKLHSFKFDFNDEKSEYNIYVKVSPVIVSQSGFKMSQEQTSTLRVPSYPREISFMGDGSIVPLSGSKTLNIVSLGVDKFDITLARIIPSQINHLISQTYGNMQRPEFRESYIFNEDNISEKFTEKITLNSDYKTPNYSSVDLSKYMKQGKGLFMVEAKADYETMDNRLILVSDIGIIYKEQVDNTAKLYALSMEQEKPLPNAKVEVLALNGTIIKTLYTNEEGVAVIPNLSDYSNEKRPVAFVVKTDNDFSYIPYNKSDRQVNYSKFNVDGDNGRRDLEVSAWTDRGLYLPGEKVNFALIAKNRNWTTTAGLPIKVKITDPKGTKIFEKDLSLTKEGLLELEYQLKESATMGSYQIDIYTFSDGENKYLKYLNDISFKVEEFEEDKLKVSSVIENKQPKGWFLTKEPLKLAVSVENLYGAAAQGNEVKATAKLTPKVFDFKDFSEYKFTDNLSADTLELSAQTISLPTQNTDALGKATFDIDLNKYSKGTCMIRFTAEAFEQESSKSVLDYTSALISPLEYIVGYKTNSNLGFLNKEEQVKINFIALNNNLDKIDLNGLTLVLKEQNYISVLTKQYDDYYRYQSVLQEKEISKQDFSINKQGSDFDLPTDKPGKYALVLYDANGQALSKIEFFIAGQNNTSFNLEKDGELVMYLNKTTFKPGEEITIDLITPYEGIGLITLENDKVYASKWFTTKTNSTIQKIRIPNNLEGGAYINISFARSRSSQQVFVSPFSYAVKYIKVEPENRVLNIDLKTPQLVEPGQDLKIEYKTSAPAKIILFGSSEGILQVAKYQTPNPLGYFFRKKSLEVYTYQIFDLMLPDFALFKNKFSTGGDTGAESALDLMFANEFKRKRLAPVTFWSKILDSNTTAKTYSYKVPDYFNGSIRVMAVAVNDSRIGTNSKMVMVKAPVILNPSAPRLAAPGDEFEVGLRIANQNEKLTKGDFTAQISTTKGLKVIGADKQDISIDKNAEKTIYFKVKALAEFGNNEIYFSVKPKTLNETYKTSYSLSVRPASPYQVSVDMGNSLDKRFVIKDFKVRDLYSYKANKELGLSQNPLALFLSLETFLKHYPYGCTEQLTSQVFPRLAYGASKGKAEKQEIQEELNTLLDKLVARQNTDGSFMLWDNGFGDDELTMYVVDMLLTAEELDYKIQRPMLNRALARIKNYVSRTPYRDYQAKLMAYGHYLLARDGESLGSYLASLEKYLEEKIPSYKKNIEGAYLAAAYKMLQDNSKAQGLIKSYEIQDKDKYTYYSDYDTSLTRNAKYLYLVAKYFPEKLNDKKEKELLKLMIRDIAMNNYNTMSANYAMLAISEYAKNFKAEEAVFKVSCQGKEIEVKQGMVAKVNSFPAECKTFDVSSDKNAPLGNFWFIEQSGYNSKPITKTSNGLEVYKELQNDKGEVVKEVKAGDDLTVVIKIKSLTGKTLTNVAITDMFASPFVFIRDSLEGSYTFAEPKEDRIVIFGDYGANTTTLTYKVKVANVGDFIVPAITAQAMYNNAISASGSEGKLIVQKR